MKDNSIAAKDFEPINTINKMDLNFFHNYVPFTEYSSCEITQQKNLKKWYRIPSYSNGCTLGTIVTRTLKEEELNQMNIKDVVENIMTYYDCEVSKKNHEPGDF